MKSPRGASGTGGQEVDQANGVVHVSVFIFYSRYRIYPKVSVDDDTNAASNPPKRQCLGEEPVAQPEQEEDSDSDEVESSGSSSEPDFSDDESRPNTRADKEIELEQEEMAKEYEEQRKEWEERDRKDEEERQRKAKLPKMVVNGVTLRYIEEDMRQLYEEEIAPRPKPPQWQNGKLLEPEPDPEPISWEAFLERQAEWHVKYPQPSRTPSREGSVVDRDATSGRSSPLGGVQENNTEESGEEGDDEEMEAQLQRAPRKRPRSQRSSHSRESSTLKRNRNKSDSEQEEDQEENN
ncbi:hypothetical protein CAEBREN_22957 [Caenorhabditis brenneri]|uniref:Uncharacterized protein n=1 Tax=Caenorhabditis brenneri TaxID=135651 RepID=G0MQH0_CAEBE|nr:hypothetical protein CAEBREN_22957 [Caenorhabditis brenneri]